MSALSTMMTWVRPNGTTLQNRWSPYLLLLRTLRIWNARSRQRHDLRLSTERDDYLLKDIGLSEDEAFREAAKPFWRCTRRYARCPAT